MESRDIDATDVRALLALYASSAPSRAREELLEHMFPAVGVRVYIAMDAAHVLVDALRTAWRHLGRECADLVRSGSAVLQQSVRLVLEVGLALGRGCRPAVDDGDGVVARRGIISWATLDADDSGTLAYYAIAPVPTGCARVVRMTHLAQVALHASFAGYSSIRWFAGCRFALRTVIAWRLYIRSYVCAGDAECTHRNHEQSFTRAGRRMCVVDRAGELRVLAAAIARSGVVDAVFDELRAAGASIAAAQPAPTQSALLALAECVDVGDARRVELLCAWSAGMRTVCSELDMTAAGAREHFGALADALVAAAS